MTISAAEALTTEPKAACKSFVPSVSWARAFNAKPPAKMIPKHTRPITLNTLLLLVGFWF
jgi:hypothetical protein